MKKKTLNRFLVLLGGGLCILSLRAWMGGKEEKASSSPIPVVVATVTQVDVPVYLKSIGTVTPLNSVEVKPQVSGRLLKIFFQEGQTVKKGELLAQIDPALYKAQLKQYEGQLQKDQAFLKNARLDLKRNADLLRKNFVAQKTYDTQKSLVEQYEGTVKSDQGLVDTAKTNLEYCRITSEIEGIVGLRQVNPGNLVQPSDPNPITTMTSLSPITVVFPLSEEEFMQVREPLKDQNCLPVDVFGRKEEHPLESGFLKAVDSQIDPTTGTIKLKALFENKTQILYPNQFVTVRLKTHTLPKALVLPTEALHMGRKGPVVFLLNPQTKTVSIKSVKAQAVFGEKTAVTGPLQKGDQVVTRGQDKLVEGTVVHLSEETDTP